MNPVRDVVVDVETTGSNILTDRVVSIGVVRLDQDSDPIDEFYTLVNPERSTGPVHIHGITNDMVRSSPTFIDILPELKAFLGKATFVAHQVRFDYGMVSSEYLRYGHVLDLPTLDTVRFARSLRLPVVNHKLSTLASYFDIPMGTHHHALDDAKTAAAILKALREVYKERQH